MNQPKDALHELVKHVFASTPATIEGLTYQELARRIGRLNKHGEGHGHGMGKVLGDMGHLLQRLEGEWGETIPHIQSLVINKAGSLVGLPDEGIKEFWPGYPALSRLEKRNKVRAEYARIIEFGSRWNKVLKDVSLEPIEAAPGLAPGAVRRFGGGGESVEHHALKEHVLASPLLVGASAGDEGFAEYTFPSLDKVDVLFKSPARWVAVEVKSRISDKLEEDYERGIYQCVKYRALLEAMRNDHHYAIPESIRVVLLLETYLPKKYRNTARSLGVEVIEDVAVPLESS